MKYPLHSIMDLQTKGIKRGYLSRHGLHIRSFPQNTTVKTSNFYLCFSQSENIQKRFWAKSSADWYTALEDICDISFLRKEKIYTKLKYSRCPQYDIISGGFAAIFAGFIGFLISEKFGIELVDSGDFYTALMYVIFSVFSLRPLLRIYSITHTPYAPYSWKYVLQFWSNLITLMLKFAVSIIKLYK